MPYVQVLLLLTIQWMGQAIKKSITSMQCHSVYHNIIPGKFRGVQFSPMASLLIADACYHPHYTLYTRILI
jgi:hypothetical protein